VKRQKNPDLRNFVKRQKISKMLEGGTEKNPDLRKGKLHVEQFWHRFGVLDLDSLRGENTLGGFSGCQISLLTEVGRPYGELVGLRAAAFLPDVANHPALHEKSNPGLDDLHLLQSVPEKIGFLKKLVS